MPTVLHKKLRELVCYFAIRVCLVTWTYAAGMQLLWDIPPRVACQAQRYRVHPFDELVCI